MMVKNSDESVDINYNLNWSYVIDHPYSILITGASVSGNDNVLLNFVKHQRSDIDKNYIYTSKIHSNQRIKCLSTECKN